MKTKVSVMCCYHVATLWCHDKPWFDSGHQLHLVLLLVLSFPPHLMHGEQLNLPWFGEPCIKLQFAVMSDWRHQGKLMCDSFLQTGTKLGVHWGLKFWFVEKFAQAFECHSKLELDVPKPGSIQLWSKHNGKCASMADCVCASHW